MIRLEQDGIFKAKPLSWNIVTSETTKSVGININFKILASLDGETWVSWAEAEDHNVYGTYYVVGREGKVNMKACEQLVGSMGWDGNLDSVAGPVPDCVVQIKVERDEYNGKVTYKAGWMNEENYVPTFGASADDVANLNKSYGSLLRGAAASIAKAKPKAAAPPAAPATPPAESKPVEPPATPAGPTSGVTDAGKPYDVDDPPF